VIAIEPGNRIPLLAQHLFKAWVDVPVTKKLLVTGGVTAASGSFARGNENNRHLPDGVYYLGPGTVPGMAWPTSRRGIACTAALNCSCG